MNGGDTIEHQQRMVHVLLVIPVKQDQLLFAMGGTFIESRPMITTLRFFGCLLQAGAASRASDLGSGQGGLAHEQIVRPAHIQNPDKNAASLLLIEQRLQTIP